MELKGLYQMRIVLRC